jgi:hypothetical protein
MMRDNPLNPNNKIHFGLPNFKSWLIFIRNWNTPCAKPTPRANANKRWRCINNIKQAA